MLERFLNPEYFFMETDIDRRLRVIEDVEKKLWRKIGYLKFLKEQGRPHCGTEKEVDYYTLIYVQMCA